MEIDEKFFRSILDRSLFLNELSPDIYLSFINLKKDGRTESEMAKIKTCVGDIYKIVNMLRDYSRLLTMAVEQWNLTGFHRARYEYHAEQCRKIADKLSAGIDYDYDKAVERCQKKSSRPKRDMGIGEDALTLAALGYSGERDVHEKTEN